MRVRESGTRWTRGWAEALNHVGGQLLGFRVGQGRVFLGLCLIVFYFCSGRCEGFKLVRLRVRGTLNLGVRLERRIRSTVYLAVPFGPSF